MSIRKTLQLTLILCSIIPLIMFSLLSYKLNVDRLITDKSDTLWQLAETNSNGLKVLIDNQLAELNLLSGQNEIYNLAIHSVNDSILATSDYQTLKNEAKTLLNERCNIYPYCYDITLYDMNKNVLSTSNSSIETNHVDNITLSYMKATGMPAIGISGVIEHSHSSNDTKKSESNDTLANPYYIEIGIPIIHTSNKYQPIVGYLITTVSISHFESFLSTIKMKETGYGILLDKNGTYIYHPDSSLIGTKVNNNKLSTLIKEYNKGNISLSNTFRTNLEKKDRLFGYSIISNLGWVLLVQQDVSEIIDLAQINLIMIICASVIFTIIMILISIYIVKKYTDPIIHLRNLMATAASGNLDVKSQIIYKNEFGDLSKSFNTMIHMIRNNYNELSIVHEELITTEEQLRNNYNHIEYLAYHDTITNLPNKLSFQKRVSQCLSQSIGLELYHAIYFIDLDNFKNINDTLGHDYGDRLLLQTAERLSSLINSDDIVSRVGGDEFLLFLEDIKDKKDISLFASQILDAFKLPFHISNEAIYVSMSIGISIYPSNGITTNTLIKNADIAMYKSKTTGKNKYTLFDKTMESELNRSNLIREVLRNVIKNNEIYIKYQPQTHIASEKIIGFEALMRIHNTKLGNISPNEFIPIAEESGLILELGEWILREACRFTKSLHNIALPDYIVSVNISSLQLNQPGFVSMVDSILKETGLAPHCLELEITESTVITSLNETIVLLQKLQALGIRISLDDFGTGYSSLNYLTNMPINTLKIDKSFVKNISSNQKDSYIAETIIKLAHNINVEVVAEGVEYKEQLAILKDKRCDIMQGYLFSKPLLPSALIALLQS